MWAAALIPVGMLESWLHPISVRIAPRNTSALPRHEVHGAHDPSRHASHDPHAPWEATKAEARLAIERAWALSADRSLRAALVESETERLASAWEAITQQAWALHLIGAWDAAIDEVMAGQNVCRCCCFCKSSWVGQAQAVAVVLPMVRSMGVVAMLVVPAAARVLVSDTTAPALPPSRR